MSMKQATKYLAPGDAVQWVISGERVNALLDPMANISPMIASLDAVLHIIVTQQAILLVGTNPVTGRPSQIQQALPRATMLGPLVGKRQNQIDIGGRRFKLSKKGAADVISADQFIGQNGFFADAAPAPPAVPSAGHAPATRPVSTPGRPPGPPPHPAAPVPPSVPAPGPACPRCGIAVQPDWDWCRSCGFDPEGRKPRGWRPE